MPNASLSFIHRWTNPVQCVFPAWNPTSCSGLSSLRITCCFETPWLLNGPQLLLWQLLEQGSLTHADLTV